MRQNVPFLIFPGTNTPCQYKRYQYATNIISPPIFSFSYDSTPSTQLSTLPFFFLWPSLTFSGKGDHPVEAPLLALAQRVPMRPGSVLVWDQRVFHGTPPPPPHPTPKPPHNPCDSKPMEAFSDLTYLTVTLNLRSTIFIVYLPAIPTYKLFPQNNLRNLTSWF